MNDSAFASDAAGPERIDIRSEDSIARWTRKLDVTAEQLKEAVDAVGDKAPDVEMHLKGTRATTNEDQVRQSGGA